MLNAIVRNAIRLRGVVLALACVLLAYGIHTLRIAQYDVFPEFAPPLAQVQALAPGYSAEQVELLVTQRIENALAGVPGLETMRSKSLAGLSLTTMTFRDGTDVLRARQQLGERLSSAAADLPAGLAPPKLLPLTSSTSVVLIAALHAKSVSLAQVTSLAQWTVRPQLMGVPGVSDVIVFGGERSQLQVQVDPLKLQQHRVTLQDVIEAARQGTALRGAGFFEGPNQRLPIQTDGQARSPEDIAAVPITVRGNIPVRLSDVAAVRNAAEAPVGAATLNGAPAVMLVIESQFGADPLAITQRLDRTFATLAPALRTAGVDIDTTVFRPAKSIVVSLHHLRTSLLIGGVLVIVVLLFFLHNLRTAVISACAIPLSLLAAVIVLHRFGVSLNTMTLGGLAIALGEVVDDAIVDVENIQRRLRQNRELGAPRPVHRVVWEASLEVRSSVVYATFIVTLALLPVLLLPGVTGQLFGPMAQAYVFAVLASLGVALTLTPALAAMLLGRAAKPDVEPRYVQHLKTRYGAMLGQVERFPRRVIAAVALACVVSAAAVPFLGASFIPALKEGHFTVHLTLAAGTSLAESVRVGNLLTAQLRQVPGVRLVAQRAGRASEVVDPTDVNSSEIEVDLDDLGGDEQQQVLESIRGVLDNFAGIQGSANTFLTERIDETISGATAPVVVEVHGDDLDRLDEQARQVVGIARQVPGAIGVAMQSPPAAPQITVRLRPPLMQEKGLRPRDVLDTVQAAFQGTAVAQIVQGNRTTEVVVLLAPDHRRTQADLAALRLTSAFGSQVALGDVATIGQTFGRAQVSRTMGQRVQMVTMGVSGRAVGDFSADLQSRLNRLAMPAGTYLVVRGEAQERSQAQRQLLVNAAIALAAIAILLWLALRSMRLIVLVLVNLPFALVGGVAGVLVTGGELSLGSLVGFVTLFGITLRNSIMLIAHYERMVAHEGATWDGATAIRGAQERLVPILMTACVTALALAPLALRSGEPGNEVEGPMAIVILGGLVTSTLLNLLVLPALALRYGRLAWPPKDEWQETRS